MKKEKIIIVDSKATEIIPKDPKRIKVEIENLSGTELYIVGKYE